MYGEGEVPMYAVKGMEVLVVSFLISALDRQLVIINIGTRQAVGHS
jgi:hypothetical protein